MGSGCRRLRPRWAAGLGHESWVVQNQRNHDGTWLQTPVRNVTANRVGIGATVFVDAGDTTVMLIGGGTGQGCQDSLSPHYGLGNEQQVDRSGRFPGSDAEVVYTGPFDVNQRCGSTRMDPWSKGGMHNGRLRCPRKPCPSASLGLEAMF